MQLYKYNAILICWARRGLNRILSYTQRQAPVSDLLTYCLLLLGIRSCVLACTGISFLLICFSVSEFCIAGMGGGGWGGATGLHFQITSNDIGNFYNFKQSIRFPCCQVVKIESDDDWSLISNVALDEPPPGRINRRILKTI